MSSPAASPSAGSRASGDADAAVDGGAARTYTAAEVDAAIEALGDPERLGHAQEVVTHAAPALQRILLQALEEGGWFGSAHAAEVRRAAGEADVQERLRAVDVLVAEQTRLGMFVGVTVGFQLARELERGREREFEQGREREFEQGREREFEQGRQQPNTETVKPTTET